MFFAYSRNSAFRKDNYMALVTSSLNGNAVKYNDAEFEVLKEAKNVYLHYVGDGSNITNPKGNTSCYRMFEDFEGTNLDLSKFNTCEITNMSFMFNNCINLEIGRASCRERV